MKIIDVTQPFASAAVLGGLEILSMPRTTKYRGPLAIVASRIDPVILSGGERARQQLLASETGLRHGNETLAEVRWSLLGRVLLRGCCRVEECDLPWSRGPWCWRIAADLVLAEPVPWPMHGKAGVMEDASPIVREYLTAAITPAEWFAARDRAMLTGPHDFKPGRDGYTGD